MKTMRNMMVAMALGTVAFASTASAQTYAEGEFRVHDRTRGELSVGTQAPSMDDLHEAIRDANVNPTRLSRLLEYGENVECFSCVPGLQRLLLSSPDQHVRESAGWWLRRRQFAIGHVFVQARDVLATDTDSTRRQYAAEALGYLMDPHALAPLGTAATTDASANVRAAAVRSLAQLNVGAGSHFLAMALGDSDVSVQEAALAAVTQVGFFDEVEPLMGLLGSTEARIRRQAARAVGLFHVADSVSVLSAMLVGDTDWTVRQAAAWALGRIGTSAARAALNDAEAMQDDDRVIDAIRNAVRSLR